jgi:superfamily I DNA/RNA helicase
MDFLFVDPLQRMDPDYIRAWWERFEAEERLLGEMGLPMPEPPWNAPGWIVETSGADAASISGTEQAAGAVPPSSEMDGSQALVVAHTKGPALVMAGAGSGKTRTITARVVRLLEKGVAPNEILCLTFTRKAAREMRERIEKKMGEGAKKITISTFHALALDLLRTYPAICGRTKTFSVWDDDVQKNEIKSLIKDHPMSNTGGSEWVSAKNVCTILDTLKETGEEIPSKAFYLALGKLDEYAWEIALAYEDLKRDCNALDFADLVWCLTNKLLGQDSPKRTEIQSRWSYVIVDEYQDTNKIQEMLLQRLVEQHQNLMVVGDEDQAIYSFRGSNVGFIRTFPERYPTAHIYLLGRNYRSTPQIVEAANALISQNRERNFKTVWSEGAPGTAVIVGRWGTPQAEARAIAHEIDRARKAGQSDAELAVLVRTRMQFIPIQMELQRLSIPFHVVGDVPWYARVDAKVILAWLRALVNATDLDAGSGVLRSWDGIGNGTVSTWREAMSKVGEPMFSRLGYLHGRPGLGAHTRRGKRLAAFAEAWKTWEQETHARGKSLRERVHALLHTLGVVNQINTEKMSPKPADVLEANRREIFLTQLLESMPDEPGSGGWSGIQKWLDDLFMSGTQQETREGVCLSTIHGSKGLEWECVWLPGWSMSIFPSERSTDPASIEEERRLAYVAVTRARSVLSVSWFAFSSIPVPRDHGPSPFLHELDPTLTRDASWTDVTTPPFTEHAERPSTPPVHTIETFLESRWFAGSFGELENTVVDPDQPENEWYGWSESGSFRLHSVDLHHEDDPIRCTACGRALRVSVSVQASGAGLPSRIRMGRRCAARLFHHWGQIFDATRAAAALNVPVEKPKPRMIIPISGPLFTPQQGD